MLWSFQRATEDGWRWSPGYRTRKSPEGWIVQRWTGPETGWQHIGCGDSYSEAREIATEDLSVRAR